MALWIAQGFGLGRIPVAPGTFGSLGGILLFLVLARSQSWIIILASCVAGLFVSVWSSGKAEKILKLKDPGSIVVDEISAVPVCFLGWLAAIQYHQGALPPPEYFLEANRAYIVAAIFAAFRFFDVVKPWPARQCQDLPGGWGVTVDDFMAAGYVNLIFALALALGWRPA